MPLTSNCDFRIFDIFFLKNLKCAFYQSKSDLTLSVLYFDAKQKDLYRANTKGFIINNYDRGAHVVWKNSKEGEQFAEDAQRAKELEWADETETVSTAYQGVPKGYKQSQAHINKATEARAKNLLIKGGPSSSELIDKQLLEVESLILRGTGIVAACDQVGLNYSTYKSRKRKEQLESIICNVAIHFLLAVLPSFSLTA